MAQAQPVGTLDAFIQALKERLWHSPCMFRLTDEADEWWETRIHANDRGAGQGERTYAGAFAPPSHLTFQLLLEIYERTPDNDEDPQGYYGYVVMVDLTMSPFQQHAEPVDLPECQSFINKVRTAIDALMPESASHYDAEALRFRRDRAYPEYCFKPWDISVTFAPGPTDQWRGALRLNTVRLKGAIIFTTSDHTGEHSLVDQIDQFVSRWCRFHLDTWEPLLLEHFRISMRPDDETKMEMFDMDAGASAELESAVPSQYRLLSEPPATRYWFLAGRWEGLKAIEQQRVPRIPGSKLPAPPEDLTCYGPNATNAYRAGYASAFRELGGEN